MVTAQGQMTTKPTYYEQETLWGKIALSLVERLSLSQRVLYRRFYCIIGKVPHAQTEKLATQPTRTYTRIPSETQIPSVYTQSRDNLHYLTGKPPVVRRVVTEQNLLTFKGYFCCTDTQPLQTGRTDFYYE